MYIEMIKQRFGTTAAFLLLLATASVAECFCRQGFVVPRVHRLPTKKKVTGSFALFVSSNGVPKGVVRGSLCPRSVLVEPSRRDV